VRVLDFPMRSPIGTEYSYADIRLLALAASDSSSFQRVRIIRAEVPQRKNFRVDENDRGQGADRPLATSPSTADLNLDSAPRSTQCRPYARS